MCDFAAILGLCSTLTLVGEILYDIKINSVVIRLDAEYLLIKNNLLSGLRSVNFQYWQFHS